MDSNSVTSDSDSDGWTSSSLGSLASGEDMATTSRIVVASAGEVAGYTNQPILNETQHGQDTLDLDVILADLPNFFDRVVRVNETYW